jgi:hypothetical protein
MNRVHDFIGGGPTIVNGCFEFKGIGQDQVKPLVGIQWEVRSWCEGGFEQFAFHADAFVALVADHFEEENILRFAIGAVGNCQVEWFILQFAMLFNELVQGFFERREFLGFPCSCHYIALTMLAVKVDFFIEL